MNCSRRDLIGGAVAFGSLALAQGCVGSKMRFATGGSMQGFCAKPMERIRVAIVELEGHGLGAIRRLAMIPRVEIAAVWDADPERIAAARKVLSELGRPAAREFWGDEGWKAMTEAGVADVLYNCCRDGSIHSSISLYAMDRGLHVMTEVLAELPGAITLDDCWALVEASERNRVNCMMLECCCYGEFELLALNLVREGVLGEVVRCAGAYVHDQRVLQFKQQQWRLQNALKRKGNFYPTHPLGPLSRVCGMNRGDRLETLVSMESDARSFEGFARMAMKGTELENVKISRGDANVTLIRTSGGKLITLLNDTATPQPYDRCDLVSGTRGIMSGFSEKTFRVTFEKEPGDGVAERYFDADDARKVRETYRHPLWKEAGSLARRVGGFGDMSFLMDLRWAFCLQNGLPLDTDVYDLATWGSIVDMSDRSVRQGCRSVDLPDFTRGGWKTSKPCQPECVDLVKMGLKA